MTLDKPYQLFLQAMMWRKCVSRDEGLQMINKCYEGRYGAPQSVENFVKIINEEIKGQKMEILRGVFEEDGSVHFSLVNLVDSPITRLSTLHKKDHLEFFKKLVASLVTSDDGLLSMTFAINLTHDLDNVKVTLLESEALIEKWVEDRILSKINGERSICLGVRGLSELAPYLKDHFPEDITNCNLCKSICIRGVRCKDCEAKIHFHCAEKYHAASLKCPSCGKIWSPQEQPTPGVRSSGVRMDPVSSPGASASSDSEMTRNVGGNGKRKSRSARISSSSSESD